MVNSKGAPVEPVCGQYAYPAEKILWNRRFADVFG
jgi:hypothetical protein